MTPSATSARAPMKQLSSMITGPACKRLQHAADAGAAGDVHVLADLRAGADRRPGVDHGAGIDMGAEIDEGRHQHHARRDIGRAPHDAVGHGAEAGSREIGRAPAGELGRHLVPPAAATRAAGDQPHRVEAEGEQHRLLQPLVDRPAGRRLLGDAHHARIEQAERRLHRIAHRPGRLRADRVAVFVGGVDGRLQGGGVGGHGDGVRSSEVGRGP